MKKFDEILKDKKFPCKISKEDGGILKKQFELDKKSLNNPKDKTDIEYIYYKEYNKRKYVLIEEYMFRDGETVLEVERAIDVNYFLNVL
ncbi:hypothetical protein [Haliovirga abyssi]|uniref:Uncharacterized protein n=1 Tax=Haliovirga abyssi TaxID=2996794 RepID=A0AAU9DSH2_9FUSO|nr:hypothetical protein [Haliovirga abyssi]BDU49974.1 hypothetical protein HLVA_05430 [Haliovirga abyssi]